jgi:hypothetical protein
MSIDEFDSMIPVIPPIENIVMNLIDHIDIVVILSFFLFINIIHLNTLILVGTAIIIVDNVK